MSRVPISEKLIWHISNFYLLVGEKVEWWPSSSSWGKRRATNSKWNCHAGFHQLPEFLSSGWKCYVWAG